MVNGMIKNKIERHSSEWGCGSSQTEKWNQLKADHDAVQVMP